MKIPDEAFIRDYSTHNCPQKTQRRSGTLQHILTCQMRSPHQFSIKSSFEKFKWDKYLSQGTILEKSISQSRLFRLCQISAQCLGSLNSKKLDNELLPAKKAFLTKFEIRNPWKITVYPEQKLEISTKFKHRQQNIQRWWISTRHNQIIKKVFGYKK